MIARQVHRIRPLSLLGPFAVHSYETVRRQDGLPQLVAIGMVFGTVSRVPPKMVPCGRERVDLG